jgi:hypothetical protein
VPLGDVNETYADVITTVFSSTIAFKAWFATAALAFVVVQLVTAARIYDRITSCPREAPRSRPRIAGRGGSRSS